MIRKDRVKRGGVIKTHIRVVEGYRPGPGMPTKQRTIRSFGYFEDQPDPEAFMAMVEEFDANFKDNVPLRIEVAANALMYGGENRRQNYGYKFLEAVYNLLEINSFIKDYEKLHRFRGEYSPSDIFKFLVLARILWPDSKRASCQRKDNFYGMHTNFTLPDIYRSLDLFADFEVELQRHLNERVKKTIGRDLSYAFYDVTNYFFEIDFPNGEDDLRKRGVSKEHRTDPIAAMGLFMDSNGLPVSMSVFPGNTSDSLTLQPTMKDIKDSYGLGRLIVVADKGLNSSKNIDAIVYNGDGFVFSQILKGKKGQRYNEKLFDSSGWTSNEKDTYRFKLFEEEYEGKDQDGKKEIRVRKVLLYWSKAEADMAKRKREEKLEKAARSVKNNAYSIPKGVDEYTKEAIVDKETGEILENTKKLRSVDLEKAEKDAMYDGYFCIITSEMDYDERRIRQVYSGLWQIEQSFRIMKTDLYARPVFVSKNEHIRAHFLICFVALLVIRIIQHRMGEKALSAERIARALGTATCQVLKGGIIHLDDVGGAIAFQKVRNKKGEIVDTLVYSDKDEIALDYKLIQETFGTNFYNVYPRQEVFNKFLKNITVA
ncbi:Transposase DDE domain protein [Sporomusa ovata DSM 2662]|uniref:IS1634 family transposase n=6 Tax=Sporomusa TaxID=2375 RepID=UPI000388735B|nr:IS1634 family transposase [Sporomusa ovata]EQB25710.1 transposase IS4 family protein [Sporomusa ovata DSM 2662]EQB27091.1 transposase IS4 family protein [Sporomusa ovata DSM 2662]EQB27650.1 transposase IS4 family protein [Sporomusa ovata DSM 2662]